MDMVSKPARRQKPKARAHGEGSVFFERARGTWAASVNLGIVNGRQRKKRLRFATQAEARQALTRMVKALDDGIGAGDDKVTVACFLEKWLAECVEGPMSKIRPATRVSYVGVVRHHLIPALGAHRLARLTPLHVRAFLSAKLIEVDNEGKPRWSPTTIHYCHGVLRNALKQAERWGLVVRNVAKLVDPPARTRKEAQAMTAEQAGKLLEQVASHRLSALFSLALAMGMRRGEIVGLRWEHLDLDAGIVRVREQLQRLKKKSPTDAGLVVASLKTDRSRRTLKLPGSLIEELKAHARAQKAERLKAGPLWVETGYVFTTELGKPLDGRNVLRLWKEKLAAAGLPAMPFHATRHTSASMLLAYGATIYDVKENHGHSQIGLTANTYAHMLDELRDATAARADIAMAAARNAAKKASQS